MNLSWLYFSRGEDSGRAIKYYQRGINIFRDGSVMVKYHTFHTRGQGFKPVYKQNFSNFQGGVAKFPPPPRPLYALCSSAPRRSIRSHLRQPLSHRFHVFLYNWKKVTNPKALLKFNYMLIRQVHQKLSFKRENSIEI